MEDYVGEYVFIPGHQELRGRASYMIFKKEGTAIEIRFVRETGEVSTTAGRGSLNRTGVGEMLILDGYEQSIQQTGHGIRLVINSDFGMYYN